MSLIHAILSAALFLVASQVALAAAPQKVFLYRNVTQDNPITIFSGPVRQVDTVDVNWRGANGVAVKGYLYADGVEIWSGMIPAYDPTFRAAPNRKISLLEIRVDSGSAFVNWAQIHGGGSAPRGCRGRCDLNFIGSLDDAGELASELISVISSLQEDAGFEANQAHFFPLKLAAAGVYEVSTASGSYRRSDVYNAVVALERQFQNQETFLRQLMQANSQFQPVMAIMTIRERYKALFGSTSYPGQR